MTRPHRSAYVSLLMLLLSAASAAAIPVQVDWTASVDDPLPGLATFSGSLGVFEVTTGTETSLLPSTGLTFAWSDASLGNLPASGSLPQVDNLGPLSFQFTSFSSGGLVPDISTDYLWFLDDISSPVYTDPNFPSNILGAALIGTDVAQMNWGPETPNWSGPVSYSFTVIPEPSTALLLGGGLLALGAGTRSTRRRG